MLIVLQRAKSIILPNGNFREFFLWRGGILRFKNGNSRWPWSTHCENVLNRQYNLWLVDYSISLKLCTEFKRMTPEVPYGSSRSRGRRSRSQRNITCAKISKIINNSARDCSIFLKIRRYFDHVTLDVPRTLRSTGQRSKSQHVRIKNAIIQTRINCRRSNLVKIIPEPTEPSSTRNTMFKVIRSNKTLKWQ